MQLTQPVALLAIDPGTCTGWAYFQGGELLAANVTTIHEPNCVAHFALRPGVELVIEVPEIYISRANWKGDPNDLIKVALQVGRWIERAAQRGCSVTTALPKEWKGQTPKDVHNARAIRKLTPSEAARLPHMAETKRHNMIDAVALGLWKLGRLPTRGN